MSHMHTNLLTIKFKMDKNIKLIFLIIYIKIVIFCVVWTLFEISTDKQFYAVVGGTAGIFLSVTAD